MNYITYRDIFFLYANEFIKSESSFAEHFMRLSLNMMIRSYCHEDKWKSMNADVISYLTRTEEYCLEFKNIFKDESLRQVIESIDVNLLTLLNALANMRYDTNMCRMSAAVTQATYYCSDMYKLFLSESNLPYFLIALEYARMSGTKLNRARNLEIDDMLEKIRSGDSMLSVKDTIMKFSVSDYLNYFKGCFYNQASMHEQVNEWVKKTYSLICENPDEIICLKKDKGNFSTLMKLGGL